MIKRALKAAFLRLGYRVGRADYTPADAYAVQGGIVGASEPVIFDVGAYRGDVAALYRQLFPRAVIHCFEPFPESFKLVSARMKGDARVFCHELAVAEETGTALLNSNLFAPSNSLLPSDMSASVYWGEGVLDTVGHVQVGTVSVDGFCRQEGISHIDILKVDAQGTEFNILLGAGEMLAREGISLIYTELLTGPSYVGQHKPHEVLALLDSFGYGLLDFYTPVRVNNQLLQVDAIFLSPSFKREAAPRLASRL